MNLEYVRLQFVYLLTDETAVALLQCRLIVSSSLGNTAFRDPQGSDTDNRDHVFANQINGHSPRATLCRRPCPIPLEAQRVCKP